MPIPTLKTILKHQNSFQIIGRRFKTSSAQYVESRARDSTFEKLMDKYKNLLKVIAIQDLILANPTNNPPSVSLDFLSRLSQKLHLNRGAASFLRKYPHIFHIFFDPSKSQTFCRLTDTAMDITRQEAEAINASLPVVVDRLVRLLSMSTTKSLPLRAVFKVWRELGLPDDFEESIISRNSNMFKLLDGHELNTHVLTLTDEMHDKSFVASVENWRVMECCREDCTVDRTEIQYWFKHCYPPGMRLSKDFKAKVKEWQRLPYVGPYEEMREKKGWPCAPGKKYYGRGPIQLTHNYNYKQAGDHAAIRRDLINNPELVATDATVSFKTAIWFWMTPQGNKPSSHNVIIGRWTPSAADRAAGRVSGYGAITNIINGGVECGQGGPHPSSRDRIGFYKRYCDLFGINYGGNLGCRNQKPFNT